MYNCLHMMNSYAMEDDMISKRQAVIHETSAFLKAMSV